MYHIEENKALKTYNTFGIGAYASRFTTIESIEELQELLSKEKDIFVLGGGSNLLLTSDISKLVVFMQIKGFEVKNLNDEEVLVTSGAGENWHQFVTKCIKDGYGGLENLSLIPGSVGASPIQNIGAYGVEMKDSFYQLQAVEIETGTERIFTPKDCNFGYRDSVFKNELKNKYIITRVSFKLTVKNHKFHTDYGQIKSHLAGQEPTLNAISNAVIKIRESKVPNPKEIGNSGSFFKNPIIKLAQLKELHKEFPEMPFYEISDSKVKIPAGWLIEKCGYKGYRKAAVGVHEKQALILVNYGTAKGSEIKSLALEIKEKVAQKFQIPLEIEVTLVP